MCGHVLTLLDQHFFTLPCSLLAQSDVLRHLSLLAPGFDLHTEPTAQALCDLTPGKPEHHGRTHQPQGDSQKRRASKAQPTHTEWPHKIAQNTATVPRQTRLQTVKARPFKNDTRTQ